MRLGTKTVDFTKGGIMKELIVFAIPLFIGAVFSLLYGMVDSAVLGRFVSVQALAAVGATANVNMLIMHLTNALTNTISIQASQARGAGNDDAVRKIFGSSVTLTLIISAAIVVLVYILSPLMMRLLGTPEEIMEDGVLYIRITGCLFAGHLFYNLFTGVLRAIGDSSTPLYFLIFSSLLNAGLDILFVVAFHWDVAGVAWATVISQFVSAALCLLYMLRKHRTLRFTYDDMKLERGFMCEYFKISLPMAFQGGMLAVGDLTMSAVINSFGTDAVAAFTIGWKCVALVQITYSQITQSLSVFTGQNYGAKQYARIREGVRKGITFIASLCVISMLVMLFFGDKLALIYLDPATAGENVLALIHEYMSVVAFFLPCLALILAYLAILRGMGHVTPTVVSSFAELTCKIGFSLLLPVWFGTHGLWFAMPLGWVLGLIPAAGFYYFGGWEKKARAKDEAAAAQ